MNRSPKPSSAPYPDRESNPVSKGSRRRRLERAAYGIDAAAAIEHAGCGAAAAVALARHREAQRAREVILHAVLRGAHGDLDSDPPLVTLPSERGGHRAGRHALHAGPRHRQLVGCPAAALREPRQRHGGAELLAGVERRRPDPRVPPRRAVEPEHGGEVVRDGGGRGVEGQDAELGGRDVGDGVVRPEEQPWDQRRREDEHRQEHDQRRQASGRGGCDGSRALPASLAHRRRLLHGHGSCQSNRTPVITEIIIESSPRRIPQLRLDPQLLQLVESSLNFAGKRQSIMIQQDIRQQKNEPCCFVLAMERRIETVPPNQWEPKIMEEEVYRKTCKTQSKALPISNFRNKQGVLFTRKAPARI
ncbi:hypothetical protein U9M48_041919 [Paspalum notatum var. saurae]|uniref:Uncharacterized protein n=1 Tax=Paspalum notatum var. saurae TaxID=547442 RepID=A0AAQ3UU30_PASNO